MVVDSSVLLHGQRARRRLLRAHRARAAMECVAAVVLFGDTACHRSAAADIFDSCSRGHHDFSSFVAVLDVEEHHGSLEFQSVPVTSAPSMELSARVASWTYWSWFREPLDIITFCLLCWLYFG
jgi:hypothetical protein